MFYVLGKMFWYMSWEQQSLRNFLLISQLIDSLSPGTQTEKQQAAD